MQQKLCAGAKAPAAAHPWRELAVGYGRPDTRRGILQVLVTALSFLALAAGALCGVTYGIWPALALTVPAAGFMVRLFTIQHDCGHGAFFKSRRANDYLGRALGVLTLTPYAFWRRRHALHHASSGNLDGRGVGDITTLTKREYLSRSAWQRFLYRLYRHPIVLFGIGPLYIFLVQHRIPTGNPVRHWRSWVSVLGTNLSIVAALAVLAAVVDLYLLLVAYLPIVVLASSIGVWLFYIQHQFEDTYWEKKPSWNFHTAALEGCSYYDLPRPLHWLTCHIGLHHIHHLCSKIPNYRLWECFQKTPALQNAKRLTLWQSLKCARLAIWDEDRRKLVSFRDLAVATGR